MILTVTLNPSLDQTLFLDSLQVGDTNRVQRVEVDAGGKGLNLSRVARALGAETLAVGFLGGRVATLIASVLNEAEVPSSFVHVAGETRTNVSIEVADGSPPTTINQRGPEIWPLEWEALEIEINRHLAEASWLALCGSLPPGVPADAYAQLTRMGQEAGARVLVDADGEPMRHALKARPHMVKPNAKEASRLLQVTVETVQDALLAVQDLYEAMGGEDRIAMISLGRDGAVLCSREGLFRGGTPPVETASSVGAGDSMLGGFLSAWARGESHDVAFRWGLAAGAATATTDGSKIAPRKVVELLYGEAEVIRLR